MDVPCSESFEIVFTSFASLIYCLGYFFSMLVEIRFTKPFFFAMLYSIVYALQMYSISPFFIWYYILLPAGHIKHSYCCFISCVIVDTSKITLFGEENSFNSYSTVYNKQCYQFLYQEKAKAYFE